ncbi:MAG: hypothetical protein II937_04260 [Bacteroidales bacterium]|nr:hypothetical protein [Bacteroidales bacterium]
MDDYFFYIISGRVTDSDVKPQKYLSLKLFRAENDHETEVLASCRTNQNGEFYFEESLKKGSKLKLVLEDFNETKDFFVSDKDEYRINFIV